MTDAAPLAQAPLAQALLDGTFTRSGDAIFVLDRDGFIDCNDAALRLFGFTDKAEFLARHPGEFAPERQPDGRLSVEVANAEMDQAFAEGHALIEWQHQRRDGSLFFSEVMLVGITLGGRPALTATIRDITRRKRAEEEVIRSRDALHQSEKMAALGSLLAGVAHELNNPLSVVLTHASLLVETSTEPRILARAEKIEAATSRCARIVRSFLAMARRKPPTREPVRLTEVVQAALDLTAYGLRSSGVEVAVAIPDDLPQVTGDADQLTQLVINLVINAQQALQSVEPPRRLAISGTRDRTEARLVFADNGPGVPEAIRSRIFDPFFTTKPPGSGTGIGLSLCRSIVRAHEGELSCEETPGGGASFVVRLPSSAAAQEALSVGAREMGSKTAASVLVVDDEPEIVEGLREIIAPLVDRVDVAGTGTEALRLIAGTRYDLLLTDLRMPELDGRGLHARLRGSSGSMPGTIVFMTGDALDGDLRRFIAETDIAVLEKPFTASDVRELVLRSLAAPAGGRPR